MRETTYRSFVPCLLQRPPAHSSPAAPLLRTSQQKFLSGFTHSRFRKDRAKKKAPEPAAYFGNRELFTEEQAPGYVASLIKRATDRSKQRTT